MRKIAIMLACFTLNACAQPTIQTHFVAQQEKGEKQMATLLFDERFEGCSGTSLSCLQSRGWNTSVDITFFFENDSTLNKTVMYNRWTNRRAGMPDPGGNSGTIYRRLTNEQWNGGWTLYTTLRFDNWFSNGNAMNSHAPPRGSCVGYTGNAAGEWNIEAFREGYGARTYPTNNLPDVDRVFLSQLDHGGNQVWYDEVRANQLGSYLQDGRWYELVVYMRGGNAARTGTRYAAWYRPYGTTNWIWIWDWSDMQFFNRSTNNPILGLGPYFHSNANNNEVRAYVGHFTVWSGDAMADGDVDEYTNTSGGGDNGNGGGTEPADPLAISNHKASTTDTTATLTWTTNKPSNSVVDYGATETRGTIARDDNNVTDHTINLSGLTANTAYYYRFSSRTADGETVMDQANSTFMTKTTDNGGGTEPEPEPIEGSLDDLTDVTLNNPVEGQVLMYRDGKWVNVDARPLVAQLVEEILGETSLVVNKPSA